MSKAIVLSKIREIEKTVQPYRVDKGQDSVQKARGYDGWMEVRMWHVPQDTFPQEWWGTNIEDYCIHPEGVEFCRVDTV